MTGQPTITPTGNGCIIEGKNLHCSSADTMIDGRWLEEVLVESLGEGDVGPVRITIEKVED